VQDGTSKSHHATYAIQVKFSTFWQRQLITADPRLVFGIFLIYSLLARLSSTLQLIT